MRETFCLLYNRMRMYKVKKHILSSIISLSFYAFGAESDITKPKCNEIVFPLNESENIVMRLEKSLDEANDYTNASLFITHGEDEYYLGNDKIWFLSLSLRDTLTPALINEFELHESVIEIGYDFNESLQNKPDIVKEELKGCDVWVGLKHFAFAGNDLVGWVYARNGELFFQVTPVYTGSGFAPITGEYCPAKDGDQIAPYEQWIKDYRPLISRVISKDIAYQWLEQVRDIIEIMEDHNMRLRVQSYEIFLEENGLSHSEESFSRFWKGRRERYSARR